MATSEEYLSARGLRIKNDVSLMDEGKGMWNANRYDDVSNPNGIINAGTAENTVSTDLIAAKLQKIDQPYEKDPDLLRYNDFSGLKSFRTTMASFLTTYAKSPAPLDPDKLVILNGCGPCITALTFVLCDANDAWLIPSPHYDGITTDSGRIPEVLLATADLTSERSPETGQQFQLTVEKLEAAYQKAIQEGINIRGLFLINPNNPLGDVYPKKLLEDCLDFAKSHKIHVIIDEIYMLSTFGECTDFVSVLSLENLPDPKRTHVIWGLSKDFAMSGLRIGAVYSQNADVLTAVKQIGYWFGIPTGMQVVLDGMLSDKEWVASYLSTNKQRLEDADDYLSKELTRLLIPHLKRPSGLFIWADFRKYINPATFETEKELYFEFLEAGVYIGPGQSYFCVEPGWFRIIYSIPQPLQQLAAKRICSVIHQRKKKLQISD